MEKRLKAHGGGIALAPGSRIPLRGVLHEIRHVPARRGTVAVDATEALILVPGELPHLPRRLVDWMKTAARADLQLASRRYAALMDVTFKRITIRDQRSRWGSCSAGGELSYSWRLILTPPHVLDYVAAHEVAHLKHMNHGPRFWRLVLTHCPDAARRQALAQDTRAKRASHPHCDRNTALPPKTGAADFFSGFPCCGSASGAWARFVRAAGEEAAQLLEEPLALRRLRLRVSRDILRGHVDARDRGKVRIAADRFAGQRPYREAAMGLLHDIAPDLGGQRAASDIAGRRVVVIADPDAGRVVGRVADEPGIAVILAGACLSADVVCAELRALSRALRDHGAHHAVEGAEIEVA